MKILNIFRQKVRIITTDGCMAQDGKVRHGRVVGKKTYPVYDGSRKGSMTKFYVVRLLHGEIEEIPVVILFRTAEGVLEHRI